MTGTRGFQKTLVEQAGEAHTGTSEGSADTARLGQTNGAATSAASKSAKKKSFVCTSNTQSHTHTTQHAVTKGNQASFSAGKALSFSAGNAFCKVADLGLPACFFNILP